MRCGQSGSMVGYELSDSANMFLILQLSVLSLDYRSVFFGPLPTDAADRESSALARLKQADA